ncbi:MAG: hypothetical protein ACE5JX_17705 [Acidobacteriota bacterium]
MMRRAKRMLLALAAMVAFLVPSPLALAQCAMCRTALANSPEGERLASGFNNGILFLLGAPFLVVGVVAFLILKAHRGPALGSNVKVDEGVP